LPVELGRDAMLRLLTVAASARAVAALTISQLGAVQVQPLTVGRVTSAPAVTLSSLWSDRGAVIFAVRRPG